MFNHSNSIETNKCFTNVWKHGKRTTKLIYVSYFSSVVLLFETCKVRQGINLLWAISPVFSFCLDFPVVEWQWNKLDLEGTTTVLCYVMSCWVSYMKQPFNQINQIQCNKSKYILNAQPDFHIIGEKHCHFLFSDWNEFKRGIKICRKWELYLSPPPPQPSPQFLPQVITRC